MTDTAFIMTRACAHAGGHAPARGRRLADADDRLRVPAGSGSAHGRSRPLLDRRRLLRFIRMWLNDGMGANGRVLNKETVLAAEKNSWATRRSRSSRVSFPSLSNDAEFFPGMSKSWALTFMINDEEAPTGRPAGAARLGRAWPICSTGSTARTGSGLLGRRRCSRLPIRRRSAAISTSRRRCTTACAAAKRLRAAFASPVRGRRTGR